MSMDTSGRVGIHGGKLYRVARAESGACFRPYAQCGLQSGHTLPSPNAKNRSKNPDDVQHRRAGRAAHSH